MVCQQGGCTNEAIYEATAIPPTSEVAGCEEHVGTLMVNGSRSGKWMVRGPEATTPAAMMVGSPRRRAADKRILPAGELL